MGRFGWVGEFGKEGKMGFGSGLRDWREKYEGKGELWVC